MGVASQSSSEKGNPKASALDEISTVDAFFRFNNLLFSDHSHLSQYPLTVYKNLQCHCRYLVISYIMITP